MDQSMNVRLAVQLLSNSVSKAIAYYYCENKYIDKYNWKNAAEMISLFNKWFDLFNTNSKFDYGLESYGLNLNSQNGILDEMSSFIEHMRKLNQDVLEHLFSFIKGMSGSASSNITALDSS
ncbi:Uncharacterized protein FWK35_00017675 [Aphis craccivora]|uniref:Transposable element P transposase-like GTP-binding insertion domain-containing protein n=1 Tax=Aphis craccivora TaxID=307492 RepID=A0A6G0Y187_APHCR|nr:Uncharacterized protein FWK35_00017675 [Aphis craccivora]